MGPLYRISHWAPEKSGTDLLSELENNETELWQTNEALYFARISFPFSVIMCVSLCQQKKGKK
jgi:hypothetical protein